MKTDSENISALFDKYYRGNISPEEESGLLDYLQNNPKTISEQGYTMLADKLVYEHSLIERKAIFQDMMKNQTTGFSPKYLGGIIIVVAVLVLGTIYLLNNTSKKQTLKTKSTVSTLPFKSEMQSKTINDSNIKVQTIAPSTKTNNTLLTTIKKDLKTNIVTQNQANSSRTSTNKSTGNIIVPTLATLENINTKSNNQTNVASKPVCPDYSKEVGIITSKCETNASNGSIELLTQNSNLEFSIDNENYNNDKRFEQLSAGTYKVYIRDNRNCSNTINGISIAETACISEYKKDLIKGQTWQVSIIPSDVKNISIYNTSGQIVFKKSQDFSTVFEWEGINSQGDELLEGFYKVVVTYQKESCIFNVSILK